MRLEILKSAPSLTCLLVKWEVVGNFNMKFTGRWFPQIVDRDNGNLCPIYIYIYTCITQIVVLVSEPVRGRSRATELPCYDVCLAEYLNAIKL